MYNLSHNEHTLTTKVQELIGRMSTLSDTQIREEFEAILVDPDTHVSDNTRGKWRKAMSEARGKTALMYAVCNLHLAGCDLRSPNYKPPKK